MPQVVPINRSLLLVAILVVAMAGHWLAADRHAHRLAVLEQEREVGVAAVASLRSLAVHARERVRECRARRVAAKSWRGSLPADRQQLGGYLVAMLGSRAVRIVELRAASGADAGEAPAVLVRWRGTYGTTLDALAALGAGAAPLRFESLRLTRVESADEPIEAEGTVVGGWLPPNPGPA